MIYISSSCLNQKKIGDAVRELAEHGFQNIELSGGTTFTENILGSLKTLKKEFSLEFLIHNYFPPPEKDFVLNIVSPHEPTRSKSVEFMKRSIQWAKYLGIDRYSFHAGYSRELKPPDSGDQYFRVLSMPKLQPEKATFHMYESIEMIQKYAEEHKVKMGAENLFPFGKEPEISLLSTPPEILKFLEYFRENDHVGLLLDLGHIVISSNYYDFDKDELVDELCKKYLHKILGIHLSGNDGEVDNHSELSPDDWQIKAALRFYPSRIPVTIECRNLSMNEISKQYKMLKNELRRGA